MLTLISRNNNVGVSCTLTPGAYWGKGNLGKTHVPLSAGIYRMTAETDTADELSYWLENDGKSNLIMRSRAQRTEKLFEVPAQGSDFAISGASTASGNVLVMLEKAPPCVLEKVLLRGLRWWRHGAKQDQHTTGDGVAGHHWDVDTHTVGERGTSNGRANPSGTRNCLDESSGAGSPASRHATTNKILQCAIHVNGDKNDHRYRAPNKRLNRHAASTSGQLLWAHGLGGLTGGVY